MKTLRQEEAGFSLLELLFVSVLLALMAGVLYSSISGILRSQEAIEDQRGTTKIAQKIIARLITEIASIKVDGKIGNTDDCFEPCPIEGKNRGSGKNAADQISFVSINASEPASGVKGNYGEVEVLYKLAKNSSKNPFFEESQEEENRNLKVLLREEIPAEIQDRKLIKEKRIKTVLAYNISSLNFRYLKPGSNPRWEDRWNKARNPQAPLAIEITLGVKGENGREEIFRTAVHIIGAKKGNAPGLSRGGGSSFGAGFGSGGAGL